MVQTTASVLHVNGASGVQGKGTRQAPFRTLTQALAQAVAGTTVQLEAGTYGSGESFPLRLAAGVTLVGIGGTVTIRGGGLLATEEFAQQSVTLQLQDGAQLRNVTVTNPQSQGIGVWLEQGTTLLTRCRLIDCGRDGVFVTDDAMPILLDNEFAGNQASGLFMVRRSKGEVRQNRFLRTGYGIAISDQAAPLLIDNELVDNKAGIVLSRSAKPVLRQNRVLRNQTGLWVQDTAQPDVGQSQDLGKNEFRDSGKWDVHNQSRQPLTMAGNQLNPNRVQGTLRYIASELPDPVAVPKLLLGKVKPQPVSPPPTAAPQPPPINLNSRFKDVIGHWAAPFVDAMAEADLVKGFFDGTFRPDALVTRAEFAALAMATFPAINDDNRRFQPFRDVPSGFWARSVIYKAQAQGFIAGFPDQTFRPNDPMIRVQAIVALINGLRLGQGRVDELGIYDDRAQVPPYAVEEVAMATRRGIAVNHPNIAELRPMQPITRAETTALVYQCLVNLGRMQPLLSPYIVRPQTATLGNAVAMPHWADDFWQPLLAQNLLMVSSNQSPNTPMTRAQFASLVVKAFNPAPQRYPVAFRDVSPSHWASEAIHRAYQAKFLSGFPDYTFAPEQGILKIQVLLALVSGLELTAKGTTGLLNRYKDQDQVPRYAVGAIATATKLGLVFNHPKLDKLAPNQVATHGEVAAIVYQGLVLRKRMPPVTSPYQVVVAS